MRINFKKGIHTGQNVTYRTFIDFASFPNAGDIGFPTRTVAFQLLLRSLRPVAVLIGANVGVAKIGAVAEKAEFGDFSFADKNLLIAGTPASFHRVSILFTGSFRMNSTSLCT